MTQAVVVGGGLVGVAAAVALARAGLETTHISPPGPPDRRTSALMMPSVDFLQEAGLIGDPTTIGHPLTSIRIIDATDRLIRAPETLFEARESGLAAFGWNFPNTALLAAFSAAAQDLSTLTTLSSPMRSMQRRDARWVLTLADGTSVETDLVVGADGKGSAVRAAAAIQTREFNFREAALVADLKLGRSLGGTSVEFHYDHGPFTLVPAGTDRANLVWIDERAVLDQVRAGGPEALVQATLERSKRLFGTIEALTPAHVIPLSTLVVQTAGRDGVILAGEAAHAFPPIGAQGLNLGLRDVADLSSVVAETARDNEWPTALSQAYATRRAGDLAWTGAMVDALFRSLLEGMLPAQTVRAAGLWALKLGAPLRRQAFRLGMGFR